jgi:hypothetical protein
VTLTASPTSVTVGSSSALTWSSTNATACTASGGWTGAEPTSGTLSETPGAAGSATYTLTCTGTGGSATASATITAKPATGGGGGGGAFDWLSIAGLAGLGLVGVRRRAPR